MKIKVKTVFDKFYKNYKSYRLYNYIKETKGRIIRAVSEQ